MPRRTSLQQFSFANGMLDPAMEARGDVKAYQAGARDLTNVLGLAQGGVRTRGGFRHVAAIVPPVENTNIRLASFTFSVEARYLVVMSHQCFRIFNGDELVGEVLPDPEVDGDEARFFTSDELADVRWTQSLDTMILVHADHAPKRLVRQHDDETEVWHLLELPLVNLPTFRFGDETKGTATATVTDGIATITTTESEDFDAVAFGDDQPAFHVRIQDGLVTLTEKVDATTVKGAVVQTLNADGDLDPGLWSVEEDSWSDTRGWPEAVHLFQGRLYFGRTRQRPQTIWGSRAGLFFDFSTTIDSLDDEAVELTLDNDQVAGIEQLFAARDFLALTSGGIYACSETPVTPANFFFQRQSELPAAPVRPVELEGAIIFVQRSSTDTFASCSELLFDDVREVFIPQDLGLLAGRLVSDPLMLAARTGSERDGAHHLLALNRDGSLAVLNTRRAQNIAAWTRLASGDGGAFRQVVCVGGRVIVLTERQIDGMTHCLIERLDPDCLLDGACAAEPVGDLPATTWLVPAHLNGAEIAMISEGSEIGTSTVADGCVETPVAVNELTVGFPFEWSVETMPLEAALVEGTFIGNRHRLIRASVRAEDAGPMMINNRPAGQAEMQHVVFDQPAVSWSGVVSVRFLGWSGGRRQAPSTVRVTGSSTCPASILSITAEVAQ